MVIDFSFGGDRRTVHNATPVQKSGIGAPDVDSTTALINHRVPASLPVTSNAVDADELLAAFLSGKSPKTIEAYKRDLDDFRQFLGADDRDHAAKLFLSGGLHKANHIALRYKTHLSDEKKLSQQQ